MPGAPEFLFLWPLLIAGCIPGCRNTLARRLLGTYALSVLAERVCNLIFRTWLARNGCIDPLGDLHCSVGVVSENALRALFMTDLAAIYLLLLTTPVAILGAGWVEWRHRRRAPR